MRFFNKIVFSKKEPITKSDIWFDGKDWKVFIDGEWKDINKPDWYASEGETGHIKNRTHCVDYPLCILNKDNTSSWIGSFGQIYVAYNGGVEILEKGGSLPISGDLVRLEYDGYTVSLVEKEEGLIDMAINFDIRVFGFIQKLQDIFIPDTIVKTTNQHLSEEDKANARYNIGLNFNIALLKYIINPVTISTSTYTYLPDDLKPFIGTYLANTTLIEIEDGLDKIIYIKPTVIKNDIDNEVYLLGCTTYEGKEYKTMYKVTNDGKVEKVQ